MQIVTTTGRINEDEISWSEAAAPGRKQAIRIWPDGGEPNFMVPHVAHHPLPVVGRGDPLPVRQKFQRWTALVPWPAGKDHLVVQVPGCFKIDEIRSHSRDTYVPVGWSVPDRSSRREAIDSVSPAFLWRLGDGPSTLESMNRNPSKFSWMLLVSDGAWEEWSGRIDKLRAESFGQDLLIDLGEDGVLIFLAL